MQHPFRPLALLCCLAVAYALASLVPPQLQADLLTKAERQTIIDAYAEDMDAFKRLRDRLFKLARQVEVRADLFGPKPSDDTYLLRPHPRKEILDLWYPMVDIYLALDNLSEKNMQFYQL